MSSFLLGGSTETSTATRPLVLVVGDSGAGKKSLFQRMPHVNKLVEDVGNLHPFDYTFMGMVNPDEAPDTGVVSTCDVWFLHEANLHGLVQLLLEPNRASATAFVIALDLSKPSSTLKKLEFWRDTIREVLAKASLEKPGMLRALKEGKASIRTHIRLFGVDKNIRDSKEDADAIELSEGMLVENLGVPIIVCGCKVDKMAASLSGSKGRGGRGSPNALSENQMVYLQQKLREVCLQLGASLIFTSAKENINTITLQKYLYYRLSPKIFKDYPPPNAVHHSRLFLPSGWDSMGMINDAVPGGRKSFSETIPDLSLKNIETNKKGDTVTAYPDDVFLKRLFDKQEKDDALLNTGVSEAKIRGAVSEMSLDGNSSPDTSRTKKGATPANGETLIVSTRGKSSRRKSVEAMASSPGGDMDPKENPKLIKNFFQSLLKDPRPKASRKKREKE